MSSESHPQPPQHKEGVSRAKRCTPAPRVSRLSLAFFRNRTFTVMKFYDDSGVEITNGGADKTSPAPTISRQRGQEIDRAEASRCQTDELRATGPVGLRSKRTEGTHLGSEGLAPRGASCILLRSTAGAACRRSICDAGWRRSRPRHPGRVEERSRAARKRATPRGRG